MRNPPREARNGWRNLIVTTAGIVALAVPIFFGLMILPRVRAQNSNEIPNHPTPQNSPCVNQPKSLKDLTASFDKGRLPLATEISGSWAEIGFFGNGVSADNLLNCTGIKRGKKFEFVMIANHYSIELDAIGMSYAQTVMMEPDHEGSMQFPVDFDGDNTPVYRCRLTQRQTLACLVAVYGQGEEFKKMPVEEDQIYRVKPIR